jgi:hypothetical protein
MGGTEVERFVADLKSNEGLRIELSGHASGVGSVLSKGYDINADEATAYIHGQAGRELNDAELDTVVSGKGRGSVTNVVTVAEAVTQTAAATVAVAVVVLT